MHYTLDQAAEEVPQPPDQEMAVDYVGESLNAYGDLCAQLDTLMPPLASSQATRVEPGLVHGLDSEKEKQE